MPEVTYYNRGVEARMALRLADFWAGADSPIQGAAVAWLRPLAESPLPLADELDRLFSGLQFGGVSVAVSGTAGDPEMREAPLKELQKLHA